MKLTLGFSPCPNDTFIFDALVNKKINTEDLDFEPVLEDIETLNKWSSAGKLDITKLSFPAFFQNLRHYIALPSGGALGNGVGPLLVAKKQIPYNEINKYKIAIPGEMTTANFLLSFAFPQAKNRLPVLFSTIEDIVLRDESDLGLLIHENRFTYMQKGLVRLMDLGDFWEKQTHSPIPLGGIVLRNSFSPQVRNEIERLIRDSLGFSEAYYPDLSDYVLEHSQELDESVMRQHIDLYVNQFSLSLGQEGRKAVEKLEEVFRKMTGT